MYLIYEIYEMRGNLKMFENVYEKVCVKKENLGWSMEDLKELVKWGFVRNEKKELCGDVRLENDGCIVICSSIGGGCVIWDDNKIECWDDIVEVWDSIYEEYGECKEEYRGKMVIVNWNEDKESMVWNGIMELKNGRIDENELWDMILEILRVK